jgi:hypothetical protein
MMTETPTTTSHTALKHHSVATWQKARHVKGKMGQPLQQAPRISNGKKNRSRIRLRIEYSLFVLIVFVSVYANILWTHHETIVMASSLNAATAANPLDEPSVSIPKKERTQKYSQSSKNGKFAYAFLLGGAMSSKKGSDHRGGLYSVVVAAHNLRKNGSTSDIILMVQISTSSNATRLPVIQELVLQKMNIEVVYLPKYADAKFEKFYNLMLEKFRILSFEEYDRILYLDYDVFPRCNLDYVLELSYTGKLQENVILALLKEPASGGFFVLKPNQQDYNKLTNIVQHVENKTMHEPFPHWNETVGWGAIIDASKGDYWVNSAREKAHLWDWYGVQADQGLLYFWTKYVQKQVSIIVYNTVERWATSQSGELVQERIDTSLLNVHSCSEGRKPAPYRDFVHLTGGKKPWHSNLKVLEEGLRQHDKKKTTEEEWLWLLKDALQYIGMQDEIALDFVAGQVENAAVGTTPGNRQRNKLIKNKAAEGWQQYEAKAT